MQEYIRNISRTLNELPLDRINDAVTVLNEARQKGRSVFIFGNGGSAATASHFASDLAKGAICRGQNRIKATAFTDNVPLLTAWANDTAYENIFAEQVENFAGPGDIVIAISGSGNSPNILRGIQAGKQKGAYVIGLTGFDGGKMKDMVDLSIVVPNHNMEQVEDMHLMIEHIITSCLRRRTL